MQQEVAIKPIAARAEVLPDSHARSAAPSKRISFVWLALLVGFGFRLLLLNSSSSLLNSDTAIVQLMTENAAHGHFTVFYWGQPYGGTLLQLSAAPVFRLFGPSTFALGVVEALWALAAVLVLRRLVSRLWSPLAGDLAAVLAWVPGAELVRLSIVEGGFYSQAISLGLLSLLWATDPRLTGSWRRVAALGAVVGLCWWTAPTAMAFAGPAVVVALLRRLPLRSVLVGSAAVVLASAPWLVSNWHSRGAALRQGTVPNAEVPLRAVQFFTRVVPTALNNSAGTSEQLLVGSLAGAVFLVVTLLAARRGKLWQLAFLASAALSAVAVAKGQQAELTAGAFRYAVLAVTALAAATAVLICRVPRPRAVAWAVVTLVCAVTYGGMGRLSGGGLQPAYPGHVLPEVQALRAALDARGLHAVYASYWTAYVLDSVGDGRITAAALEPRRYPPYEARAALSAQTTIVVNSGGPNDVLLRRRHAELPAFTTLVVGGLTVFCFAGRFDPYQFAFDQY